MARKTKRTYLDANVLMAAFHSDRDLHAKAVKLLLDESRNFLATSLVELELTQPQFNPRHRSEAEFYLDYLRNVVSETEEVTEAVIVAALDVARRTGAAAMDAMHLACAMRMGADEIVTAESKGKPMYRETRISVRYLGDV